MGSLLNLYKVNGKPISLAFPSLLSSLQLSLLLCSSSIFFFCLRFYFSFSLQWSLLFSFLFCLMVLMLYSLSFFFLFVYIACPYLFFTPSFRCSPSFSLSLCFCSRPLFFFFSSCLSLSDSSSHPRFLSFSLARKNPYWCLSSDMDIVLSQIAACICSPDRLVDFALQRFEATALFQFSPKGKILLPPFLRKELLTLPLFLFFLGKPDPAELIAAEDLIRFVSMVCCNRTHAGKEDRLRRQCIQLLALKGNSGSKKSCYIRKWDSKTCQTLCKWKRNNIFHFSLFWNWIYF